jgi:hypothetical protein
VQDKASYFGFFSNEVIAHAQCMQNPQNQNVFCIDSKIKALILILKIFWGM